MVHWICDFVSAGSSSVQHRHGNLRTPRAAPLLGGPHHALRRRLLLACVSRYSDGSFFLAGIPPGDGREYSVPTESLHPDDTVATLSRMVSPIGLDFLDVVFRLEKWLNISIPRDLCATEGMSREEWAAFRQQTTTLQGMGNYMVKGLKALVAQKSKDAIPPTTP